MFFKNILQKLRARRKKILWGAGIFLLVSLLLFKVLDWLYPLNTQRLNYSTVVLSSDGSIMSAFLSKDDKWRIQIRKEDIPEGLKKAFIYKEDKYFYYHPGVNLIALARAFFQDIRAGKVVSGASTITMQVVRMLSPERRTFTNKFKEIFKALQLELHYSKQEILEMYFNLLPYGGNVEGIKAASLIYLHKLPINLSPAEIAVLMIVPNSPRHYRFDNNNGAIIAGRNKWLERMGKAKLFKEKEIQQAISEPLNAKRMEIPKVAPQFCIQMANKTKDVSYIQTTIDLNMQKKAQNILSEYVQKLMLWNITNAAVLIVRNKDHAVMAYVGSSNFNDLAHQGQVDGVDAIRSPGSALKPIMYALAFDQGLATPKTILYDVPSNFSGYQPMDYDRTFRGKVTVEDALLNSLNVPAVKMLSNMDIATYINVLENGGCHSLVSQQQKLGLSLVLGGCGIKLKELTGLYVTLANGGQFAPLRYTKDQPEIKPVQLISTESSFMVSHILTEMERTDVPANMDDAEHFPKIAWKTGTSYGHHDGWCVGYNDKYTVGVWVGNFNAAESQELSGASCAVPLMAEIFGTLSYYNDFNWLKFPAHLGVRWVCSETGKLPDKYCTNLVPDYYIPSVSSTETCDHMKMVYTDAKGTMSYCRSCLPKAGYVEKLYPSYSSEMILYFDLYKIPYKKIPPHNPECPRVYNDHSLTIQSPVNGTQYLLMKNESHNIMLKCNAGNDVSMVYWYIDDKFFGKSKPDESIFFSPNSGNVKVSCTDDKGRTAHIRISVKEI
jgi:penicillin-binding protein 1C